MTAKPSRRGMRSSRTMSSRWWRSPPGPPGHPPRPPPHTARPRAGAPSLQPVGHRRPPGAATLRRDTHQGSQDGLPVKGFEQIVEGPELITQGFVVHNREHNDGNVSGGSVCLQLVQELPAVLARHEDVKRDGQWAEGPRLLDSPYHSLPRPHDSPHRSGFRAGGR